MIQLERLIPYASFIEWRSNQRGAGSDAKNNDLAIVALETLKDQLSALDGTPLHERLVMLWEAEQDRPGERDRFSEIVAEELSAVGFTAFPVTGEELLENIAHHLERENRRWAS